MKKNYCSLPSQLKNLEVCVWKGWGGSSEFRWQMNPLNSNWKYILPWLATAKK